MEQDRWFYFSKNKLPQESYFQIINPELLTDLPDFFQKDYEDSYMTYFLSERSNFGYEVEMSYYIMIIDSEVFLSEDERTYRITDCYGEKCRKYSDTQNIKNWCTACHGEPPTDPKLLMPYSISLFDVQDKAIIASFKRSVLI